ncbi:type IV pilin N-terminal domain-containing protein [Halobellus ordinarius]|uniref:type IV pilin N-terminal domain-containing protein n=1 Tax=Halobellus ordinarius TaxID=3075120 RepID=UPI002880138B|nr:type IV pilin N-terminal domain-containing protein [Halobellus sp. ZY16]
MSSGNRGQSEIIGTLLLTAVVIISVTLVGVGFLTAQSQGADRIEQPSKFETTLGETSLTVTHLGGTDYAFADLALVIQQGDAETRYDLSTPSGDLDADAVFEGGESVTVSHSYTGEIRILLIDTSAGGSILYDETKTAPGTEADLAPTIERFDVTDTSSGGDASYDVTWNASDDQGDIVEVSVELISDGTTVDTATTTFGDVGSTGVNTDTLTNASGGGEIYEIKLTVTDAAGNTASESTVDTADSEIGLRSPVFETFSVTDLSTGSEVSYDYEYNVSDPDGDLVRVRLELVRESTDTLADNVTDTYSENVTTGPKTGTLSDPDRDKQDGEKYRIDILATDLEGNDVLASATDVADGDGTSGGTGSPPTIDRFDVTDTSSGGDVSFDVTWEASDVDGNLQNATLRLWDKNKNNIQDSVTYTIGDFSNGSDTGTQTGTLSLTQGNNFGKEYVIEIVVNDDEGKTGTQDETQTADGDGGSGGPGSAPTIDRLDVTDTTVPSGNQNNDASFDVTWEASDVDGNLQDATLELIEVKNNNQVQVTIDYTSAAFTNGSDTGTLTESLSDKNGEGNEYIIRITVNDDTGQTATQDERHIADGDDTGSPP